MAAITRPWSPLNVYIFSRRPFAPDADYPKGHARYLGEDLAALIESTGGKRRTKRCHVRWGSLSCRLVAEDIALEIFALGAEVYPICPGSCLNQGLM
jgi:hypothetical protein